MTALKIIGILLIVLVLLSFLRVGAVVRFGGEDGASVKLRVGPLRLGLPRRKGGKKKEKEEKPEEAEPAEESKKKKRKLPQFAKAELWELLGVALRAVRRTLWRVGKRLRIEPLDLTLTFGGPDPYQAGKSYGYANAALWTLLPRAEEWFYLPNPVVRLRMDCEADGTSAEGTAGASLRICDVFAIALTALVPLGRWYLGNRWRRRKERKAAGKESADTAEKEPETPEAA